MLFVAALRTYPSHASIMSLPVSLKAGLHSFANRHAERMPSTTRMLLRLAVSMTVSTKTTFPDRLWLGPNPWRAAGARQHLLRSKAPGPIPLLSGTGPIIDWAKTKGAVVCRVGPAHAIGSLRSVFMLRRVCAYHLDIVVFIHSPVWCFVSLSRNMGWTTRSPAVRREWSWLAEYPANRARCPWCSSGYYPTNAGR